MSVWILWWSYAAYNPTPLTPPPTSIWALPVDGLPQKSFTAQYYQKEKYSTNKLEEYFKLPIEDFKICNPIQWWKGQQDQFLCLFQLVCNILCIPDEYFSNFNPCKDTIWIWFVSHRFCCCRWKDLLQWAGHHFSQACQSSSWHNSHTYAC